MTLNPEHKHVLVSCFLDIHGRLAEMEALIVQGAQSSAFSQHSSDVSPAEAEALRDNFARIRAAMLACLEKHDIPLDVRRISLRWTLQTHANFLRAAVAELGPEHLRGYGTLSAAARDEVERIQQDIARLVDGSDKGLSP